MKHRANNAPSKQHKALVLKVKILRKEKKK